MAAITIPTSAIQRPEDSEAMDDQGRLVTSYSFTDDYSSLRTFAVGLHRGDTYGDATLALVNWQLRKIPGGQGILTLNFVPYAAADGEGGGAAANTEEWEIRAVRNDMSILAYCGSGEYDANRAWIECWQKEPDAAIANAGNYTKPDGTVAELMNESFHDATLDVIMKLQKGVESVMRFYPLLVRTRSYGAPPGDLQENLATIDTPATPGTGAQVPAGLAAFVAKYEWLKADDTMRTSNGKWIRTEAWMGLPTAGAVDGHPWDADLYGTTDRWTIPHAAQGTTPST